MLICHWFLCVFLRVKAATSILGKSCEYPVRGVSTSKKCDFLLKMLYAAISNCASCAGGEHIFRKAHKHWGKTALRSDGACEKEEISGAMHELRAVVHEVVFPLGSGRRKTHGARGRAGFSRGLWSEKKPNRTNKGVVGTSKETKIVILSSSWGSKKWYF